MLFLNSTYKEHSAITGTAHMARFAAFEKIEFGCPNPSSEVAFTFIEAPFLQGGDNDHPTS
jgi:hypothetical protein